MARSSSNQRAEENVKLGEAISARRRAVGHSQKQLAEKVGVHEVTLSEWERGLRRPNATKLARVARELGLAVVELIAIAAGERPVGDLLLHGATEIGGSVADFVRGEDPTAEAALQLPHDAYLRREELLTTLRGERRPDYQLTMARYLSSGPVIRQIIRHTQGVLPTDQRITDTMRELVDLFRPSGRHRSRIGTSDRRRSR